MLSLVLIGIAAVYPASALTFGFFLWSQAREHDAWCAAQQERMKRKVEAP